MKTYLELFDFLISYNGDIKKWLEKPWKGKDKQECLLRLFAGLGLIEKLNEYNICKGNFNKGTIQPMENIKDVFYNEDGTPKQLKDKGDASDLCGIMKSDENNILALTSKNLNKTNIGNLDISDILLNFEPYKKRGKKMSLGICIRDKEKFYAMINRTEKTSQKLKQIVSEDTTIIIDWEDLEKAYVKFRKEYSHKKISDIIKKDCNNTIFFRFHQKIGISKTIDLKNIGKNKVLWGHIQRSGKSFMIAGTIIEDSKDKEKCNYLIITTSPNETLTQYTDILNCSELEGFTVSVLNGKNKSPVTGDKNIIICSKQFIQTKTNKTKKTPDIKWFKDTVFEMCFVDESHNGGTTELAKTSIEYYSKNAFTVYITATYLKPVNNYNIPREDWILWDLEDINLCKNIRNQGNIEKLINKHGVCIEDLLNEFTYENIEKTYEKFPQLMVMANKIDETIIQNTENTEYGWSVDGAFLLKQSIQKIEGKDTIHLKEEFQNETENVKLWRTIFGNKNNIGIPDKEYPDNIVFMKRIEKICKNSSIGSRFVGDNNEPYIIMAFLPQLNIDTISNTTIKVFKKHKIAEGYLVVSINSKVTTNPKREIEEARIRAKNENKKGVLVLSGRQLSLGVSIDMCDIVLLLNNNNSYDMIYQMMFRCMTEGEGKKCGFVVDMNIHRIINNVLIPYSSLIKPEMHPRDAVKYLLEEKLINLNADHWMPCFSNNSDNINILSKHIYAIHSADAGNSIKCCIDRLKYKQYLFSIQDFEVLNKLFSRVKIQKKWHKEKTKSEGINKGIEKIKVEKEDGDDDDEDEEDELLKFIHILSNAIPVLCVLTLHEEDTTFVKMCEYVKNNAENYNVFVSCLKTWLGKDASTETVNEVINIFNKYLGRDVEISNISRLIKEVFIKNIYNTKELSKVIDEYIIPRESEKKDNSEVSTPYNLRQEMLDIIPETFWTKKQKVFEPCSGKGGFLIDIIDRFMKGLVKKIPNTKKRYKFIVEECLYFSDINPLNIFINRLLIDPYNEYKLNCNEGNTLELDILKNWGLEGFDAVIGNPPYEKNSETSRKALNHNLWSEFINYSFDLLYENCYLLFITPNSWMSPTNKNKIFYENYILHLNVSECEKWFVVGSKFSYYLVQKTNKKDITNVVCSYKKKIYKSKILLQDCKFLPSLLNDTTLSILDKFYNNNLPKVSFKTTSELHNTTKKNNIRDTRDDSYEYPIRHTAKRNIRYSNIKHSLADKSKILMNLSGNLNPVYDNGILGFTQAQLYLLTDNSDFIKILNSKLYKMIFEICKWSGFNIDKIYQNIPFIKNENDIYNLLELTETEINFIETY